MCRLIETICIKDGEIQHLSDHQDRMDRSVFELFGSRKSPNLEKHLEIPTTFSLGWIKCRVVYQHIIEEINWKPYQIRPITSIALVHHDHLDYSWKYEDRSIFEQSIFAAQTDDVIIVKNGFLTDASYANIALKSGREWITPSTPLLPGTQRKRLIGSGKIKVATVEVTDLAKFQGIKYINAMMDWDTSPEIAMDVIRNL